MDDMKEYLEGTVTRVALEATNSLSEQIMIYFDTDSPDHPTLSKGLSLKSGKALEITGEALKRLGWDPLDHGWRIRKLIASQSIVGNKVTLCCVTETLASGTTIYKVKSISVKKELDAERIDTLEARIQEYFKDDLAGRITSGAAYAPEDDIPF